MYPAFHLYLDNGKEAAERDYLHQQETKEVMYKFQQMNPETEEFHETFEKIHGMVLAHMAEEEEGDITALDGKMSSVNSEILAKSFEVFKNFAATRSHPSAPQNPILQVIFMDLQSEISNDVAAVVD